jgi:hypothetical protein
LDVLHPHGIITFGSLGFRVVGVLVPNLLGVTREGPEQVRDSNTLTAQTSREPERFWRANRACSRGGAEERLAGGTGLCLSGLRAWCGRMAGEFGWSVRRARGRFFGLRCRFCNICALRLGSGSSEQVRAALVSSWVRVAPISKYEYNLRACKIVAGPPQLEFPEYGPTSSAAITDC